MKNEEFKLKIYKAKLTRSASVCNANFTFALVHCILKVVLVLLVGPYISFTIHPQGADDGACWPILLCAKKKKIEIAQNYCVKIHTHTQSTHIRAQIKL